MHILNTGVLTGVTGAAIASGTSSAPIDISFRKEPTFGCWLSVEGDTGRTGGSVAVYLMGNYSRSGGTWAIKTATPMYLVKSGTSITGPASNGCYIRPVTQFHFPFIKVAAVASKSGSTQHGTGTTNALQVRYAIVSI